MSKPQYSLHALTLMQLSEGEINIMIEHAEGLALGWRQTALPPERTVIENHQLIQRELDGLVKFLTEVKLGKGLLGLYGKVRAIEAAHVERSKPIQSHSVAAMEQPGRVVAETGNRATTCPTDSQQPEE